MKWTVAQSIDDMDQGGVATSILSISEPGVFFGNFDAARKLARETNEFGAKVIADHPRRFGMFATVPLPDVDGSLREIEYTLDTLEMDGICMMTDYEGKFLGDPAFTPVMEELNRRKALVFIHPLAPICCAPSLKWIAPSLFEFTQDTNRCVFSLLFTGTLAQFPDIRFIFCHSGAAVPILAGRAAVMGVARQFADKLPNGIDHELRKLHYDVALQADRSALAALFAYVPISQVLLGSDYPFGTSADGVRGLNEYGLKPEDLAAIYRGNAERLLPRFALTTAAR